jgi:hypothetical protein
MRSEARVGLKEQILAKPQNTMKASTCCALLMALLLSGCEGEDLGKKTGLYGIRQRDAVKSGLEVELNNLIAQNWLVTSY